MAHEDIHAMYQRVFEGHKEGALILEDLIERFGGNLYVKGGEEGRRQTDYNLGKREILDFIVMMVNRGNGVDPNAAEIEE